MPKPSMRAEVNSFVQGLVTEASPLNYPPNAAVDIENFELNRDGTLNRRLGIDLEEKTTYHGGYNMANVQSEKPNVFLWKAVNGDASKNFVVVYGMHSYLTFYDANSYFLSGDGYLGSLTVGVSGGEYPSFSFASINGKLIVCRDNSDLVYKISYISSTFSIETNLLMVRDQWGVEETGITNYESNPTYRGAVDPIHTYNLRNQSWGIPRKDSTGTLVDPIVKFNTDLGKYPSNSEMVWAGLQFQPVTAGSTFERLYTNLYDDALGAKSVAARGYFIIPLGDRGAYRNQVLSQNSTQYPTITYTSLTSPTDKTDPGIKAVCEYAGRIWYSGFNGNVTVPDKRSPNLSSYIAYSQLITTDNSYYKCYQDGDPTSRESSDLVDTDGGLINLVGATNILGMRVLGSSLIVIASNGVWEISGGSDYGFTPTNYKVTKLSTFGGVNNNSIVVANDTLFYWSYTSINVVSRLETGILVVNSVTDTTIKTFYNQFTTFMKESSYGVFDPINSRVRWLYRTDDLFASGNIAYELVFDLILKAFYKHKIVSSPTAPIQIACPFVLPATVSQTQSDTVYSVFDEVLSSTDTVVITVQQPVNTTSLVRYLCFYQYIIPGSNIAAQCFGLHRDITFADWKSYDNLGTDAKAYFLAGHQTAGDSAISKQIPYLTMYMHRTEDGVTSDLVPDKQSSCFVRCQWDFSNTINSNKWSPLMQVYRYRRPRYVTGPTDTYDTGFEVVVSKSKLRGRGKTFALYAETEATKDCKITGWNLSVNGNPNV